MLDKSISQIRDELGYRLEYPDTHGGLAILKNTLLVIEAEDQSLDLTEMRDSFDALLKPSLHDGFQKEEFAHTAKLKSGMVMVVDEDKEVLRHIGSRPRAVFADSIKSVFEHSHAAVESDAHIDVQDAVFVWSTFGEYFQSSVEEKVQKIKNFIPAPEHPAHQADSLREALRVMFRHHVIEEYQPYGSRTKFLDAFKDKLLGRHAVELSNMLSSFANTPERHVAEWAVGLVADRFVEEKIHGTRSVIAAENSRLMVRHATKKQTYKTVSKPAANGMNDDESQAAVLNPIPEVENHEGVRTIARHTVNAQAPWQTETVSTELDEMEYQGGSIYVGRFVEQNLEKIAKAVRDKSPTQKDELNMFDAITHEVVKMLCCGIMPWHGVNSIKRVSSISDRSPYAGESIWRTVDVSPNTPRLYFSLKEVEQVVTSEDVKKLDESKKILLIVAETDKANQLEVLQTITKQSRRFLRNNGAGSI